MKSVTSFCNRAVLKKDLLRFCPAWILFSVFALLFHSPSLDLRAVYYRALNVTGNLESFSFFLFLYAFVCAQLLFGDLFQSRSCQTLHAMPLRRESWYVSHLVSGFLFTLIPLVLTALFMLFRLGGAWSVIFWWLLICCLEMLFFFGAAVFSCFLSGNRIGSLAWYAIVNFLSVMAMLFAKVLFEPLMFGVTVMIDPYILWCPLLYFMKFSSRAVVIEPYPLDPGQNEFLIKSISPAPAFLGPLVLWALLGAVLLILALFLYRRRHLECAGDLLAFHRTQPVFLFLLTLGVGAFSQGLVEFFGLDKPYIFLWIGLLLGYFGGKALLRKDLRVFYPRSLVGFALIAVLVLGSLFCVDRDVFGIVSWIPEKEQIASVSIYPDFYNQTTLNNDLTEPEDLENILFIHRYAVDNPIGADVETGLGHSSVTNYAHVTIYYTLTDGRTVRRNYPIATNSSAGKLLGEYYSSMEYILGIREDQISAKASAVRQVYTDFGTFTQGENLTVADAEAMLRAIAADMREGNLTLDDAYHYARDAKYATWLEVSMNDTYFHFSIYDDCTHFLSWLETVKEKAQ